MRKIYITESQFKRIVNESLFKPRYNGLKNTLNFGALSKAAIQNGFTLIGYHNTKDKDIYKHGFIARDSGIHFGSLRAAKDRSVNRYQWDFSDEKEKTYTYKFFLKAERPLIINKDFDWELTQWAKMCDNVYNYFLNTLGWKEVEDPNGLKGFSNESIKSILNRHGYDCIIYKNEVEDKGKYSIAIFNPCNIKLAKQTYDDNGSPIPLEQRFNTNTSDTRY